MSRVKSSYINIAASLLQQIIGFALGFISRMLFIHFLGVEILGLNNTFESILGTLALADLGIQRAIAYNLYEPFEKKNIEKINSILCIYKLFYRAVAIFILIGAIGCACFLPYIITGFEFERKFILYFGVLAVNSSASYLLAYKRILFYADQKDYYTKFIDAGCSLIFLTIKIWILFKSKSYMGYLIAVLVQTIASNIIVHVLSSKKYNYIVEVTIDREIFKKILSDLKDVICGKVASFVYDSTDNLVISAFVSTTMVGLLGNYVLITSSIKKILNSLINPLGPIVGNLVLQKDNKEKKRVYEVCDQYCFWISMLLLVPTFGLIDNFISLWIGSEYLMSKEVGVLLVWDLFIFIRHGIPASFILGQGLFRYEKKIDIIAAALNFSISIILVQFIGITGVLAGTIISGCFTWIGRKYLVFKYCLEGGRKELSEDLALDGGRFIVFGFMLLVASRLTAFSITGMKVIDFCIQGCELEAITMLIVTIVWRKNKANRQLIKMVSTTIRNKFTNI